MYLKYHTISVQKLENPDQDCWSACGGKQGKCRFCGTEGYCCRKDFKEGDGCDGTFGGEKHHLCVLKPGGIHTFLQKWTWVSIIFKTETF